MSESCNIVMPECGDPMPSRNRLNIRKRVVEVLEGMPRILVSRRMILFTLVLGNAMGMRSAIM